MVTSYLQHANDLAHALFSFESLAAYEAYRQAAASDPDARAAYALAERTGCITRYERSFLCPLLPPGSESG